jgi:hypothetical protein
VRRLALLALLLFPLALFHPANVALAQQPQRNRNVPKRTRKFYLDEPATKLEEYQDRIEAVIIRGFMSIGRIGGRDGAVDVSALELKDTSDSTKVNGIMIAISETSQAQVEIQSFLDYDEIDPLIRGIDLVARADDQITKMPNFSATYRTRDDFSVIVFKQTRSGLAVRLENTGLNGSGGFEHASILITLDELNRLRGMILEAKQRLDESSR